MNMKPKIGRIRTKHLIKVDLNFCRDHFSALRIVLKEAGTSTKLYTSLQNQGLPQELAPSQTGLSTHGQGIFSQVHIKC